MLYHPVGTLGISHIFILINIIINAIKLVMPVLFISLEGFIRINTNSKIYRQYPYIRRKNSFFVRPLETGRKASLWQCQKAQSNSPNCLKRSETKE